MGAEEIEFRKVIKFGANSHIISLPKGWLDRHKINKGDIVYYLEQGDNLVLTPKEKNIRESKSIVLDAENKDIKRIRLEIISAYLKNYTTIEIRGKNALRKYNLDIREILHHDVAGLEVIEQTSSKIVVKDLIDLKEVSLDETMRRADMILRAMMDDAILCLGKEDPEHLKYRDKDINRLTYLSFRLLNYAQHNPYFLNSIGVKDTYLFARWVVMMRIEEIGDQVKRIARFFHKSKLEKEQKKDIIETYSKIRKLYEEAMKSFYTKDLQLAITNEFTSKDVLSDINKLLKNFSNPSENLIRTIEFMKVMASSIGHISREVVRKE